jgi:OOP family OmpA-OmpF porin
VIADQTSTPLSDTDLGEESPEKVSQANDKAKGELASLEKDLGAKGLVAALNDSIVNFAHGRATVPNTMIPILQSAARDMNRLPAGYVFEIAGYTDSTGNSADNTAISQRRADAVRDALVKAGANADMLVAKGYGSANPIADNNTREGRARNRRIEYRIIKTP